MTRYVAANLDAEAELAGLTLPAAARARLSAAATLLAAFCAGEDDVLCTPEPVDPGRVPALPWLPRPRLLAVPRPWRDGDAVLPWCVTPRLQPLPRPPRPPPTTPARSARSPPALPAWLQHLWTLPRPAPEVVAHVAHRAVQAEIAGELSAALPEARVLDSVQALQAWLGEHVSDGHGEVEAGAAHAPAWVLKPCFSAAGQGQLLGRGGRAALAADPLLQARVRKAFAQHGALLAEPWLSRVDDLGVCGAVSSDGVALLPVHRLLVDARGRFRGIALWPDAAPPDLPAAYAARLQEVARRAGAALARRGYAGPFGLDAFVHRGPGGEERLRPFVELNPRFTFGHVARALQQRRAAVLGPGGPAVLRFGSREPPPPPAGVVREGLLHAGAAGGAATVAWLDTGG